MTKICAECRHYRHNFLEPDRPMCVGPQRHFPDIVQGTAVVPMSCYSERSRIWRLFRIKTCGPDARYFEPKERSTDYPGSPPARPSR